LWRDGEQRRIHGKYMSVLVCLAERGGVVSRRELFDEVWPESVVVDECLTRAISELRKALGDDPRRPRYIETIPKKGYRTLVPAEPLLEPVPSVARTSGPRRLARMRSSAMLAGLGLALPLTIVLAFVISASGLVDRAAPEIVQLTSLPGREGHPALSPGGDRLAFVWDSGKGDRLDALYIQEVGGGQLQRLTDEKGRYAFPTWSHDGQRVAYMRIGFTSTDICSRPVSGGVEQVLVAGDGNRYPFMPEYSPDGELLAYAATTSPTSGAFAIYLLRLATGETRRLSEPGSSPAVDLRPRFSHDGRWIAYLRSREQGFSIGVVAVDGSSTRVVSVGNRQMIDLAWDPGAEDVLLFTTTDGLWKVSSRGGEPKLVAAGSGQTSLLASSAAAGLVAYVEAVEDRNIWLCRLGAGSDAPRKVVASSRTNARPAWSHDGCSIAFVSDRSGEPQLWLCDAEGNALRRLTDYPSTSLMSPAWSPDDRYLAYVALIEGQAKVCTLDVEQGGITVLSEPGTNEMAPSWSGDGRYIYLSRQQEGGWVVARRPACGGPAIRISTGLGFGAIESPAGDAVYYGQVQGSTAQLWRKPLHGGTPQLYLSAPADHLVSWSLGTSGLYLCKRSPAAGDRFALVLHPFSSEPESTLLEVTSRSPLTFDISPDESTVVFDRSEYSESDVVGLRWRL
jgi:Tol biopolymer transport system component